MSRPRRPFASSWTPRAAVFGRPASILLRRHASLPPPRQGVAVDTVADSRPLCNLGVRQRRIGAVDRNHADMCGAFRRGYTQKVAASGGILNCGRRGALRSGGPGDDGATGGADPLPFIVAMAEGRGGGKRGPDSQWARTRSAGRHGPRPGQALPHLTTPARPTGSAARAAFEVTTAQACRSGRLGRYRRSPTCRAQAAEPGASSPPAAVALRGVTLPPQDPSSAPRRKALFSWP
jgi:hypothetical protein